MGLARVEALTWRREKPPVLLDWLDAFQKGEDK